MQASSIVIRTTTQADTGTLQRLAVLDEKRPLVGPALLAEVNGVARAALALDDGRVVANPFFRTAALVTLLHAHRPSLNRPVR